METMTLKPAFGTFLLRKDEEEEAAPIRKLDTEELKNKSPEEDDKKDKKNDKKKDEDKEEKQEQKEEEKKEKEKKEKKKGSNAGIIISIVVIVLALLAIFGVMFKDKLFPKAAERHNTIEPVEGEPGAYMLTVYAPNGTKLAYETATGRRKEAVVNSAEMIIFKIYENDLIPAEPLEDDTYNAVPKVYVINADGSEKLIEGLDTIPVKIPALNVELEPEIKTEDGVAVITGRAVEPGMSVTVGGEEAAVEKDGTFVLEKKFEESGEYVLDVVGSKPGCKSWHGTVTVKVELPGGDDPVGPDDPVVETSLIQFPWEYGDTSFSQRIPKSKNTLEVKGKVPAGSTLKASCKSASLTMTDPVVGEDGSFSFKVTMEKTMDYAITLTCTDSTGKTEERVLHVQRAPEYSTYKNGAKPMKYSDFGVEAYQAYVIKGTVTEIIKDDDYYLAVIELEDGNKLELEYHYHYGTAGSLEVGKSYTKIYGRPNGVNDEGMPTAYVWFIDD